jgi:hypothetical protein
MSIGPAIAVGAVTGLALGLVIGLITDVPLAPDVGLVLGAPAAGSRPLAESGSGCPECRDYFAGHPAGVGGHLVDDLEPAADVLRCVDENGEDWNLARRGTVRTPV